MMACRGLLAAPMSSTGMSLIARANRLPCDWAYRDHVAADDAVIGIILPDRLGEIGEGYVAEVVRDRRGGEREAG
jgi:hypothetical protein